MEYFLIILILFLAVLLGMTAFRPSYAALIKKLALPACALFFILCLVFFSDVAVNAALKGINLWFNIVFPSLFPFFVASELLNRTGFVRAMGVLLQPVMQPLFNVPGYGSFAFLMGITSGYPVGAKITADLRESKLLSRSQAERLLAFSNNSGPLFIIGAVSVGMFRMPEAGLFLLGCHILACITVGIILGLYSRRREKAGKISSRNLWKRFREELLHSRDNANASFGTIFGEAVKNSISLILAIGGFIILFSVIINLLLSTGLMNTLAQFLSYPLQFVGISQDVITSILCGTFEITTGTNIISRATDASLAQRLAGASFILGWAGLSVHAQVVSITSRTDIRIKTYLLGKFMQGCIAAFYTWLGIQIAGPLLFKAKPAFAQGLNPPELSWQDYLMASFTGLSIALIGMGILALISLGINVLSHRRKQT